jgi:hypothetical protein
MDVLAYSAFNQKIKLNQQIVAQTSCLSTKCSETAALQATAAGISTAAVCWLQCIEPCLLREPQSTSYYACIPDLTGATDGFKVCGAGTYFQCGACCAWEVPAGVTRVRFQLWGAGGGSAAGMCCGGSPFGSTGAYASVIIPVTEGDIYTICSGCAYCYFPCCTEFGRYPGCSSFVAGNGLSNFCAQGGRGSLGDLMAGLGAPNTNRLQNPRCVNSGACICCAGAHYCFSNSCATCGIIPYSPGANYFGTATSTSEPSIVYGIRGMYPLICFETNHYGYQCHPPIYGFVGSSQCVATFSSGTCCGFNCNASGGTLNIPGAGGVLSHAMGGSNGLRGDAGRKGMVCISYC